MNIFKGPTLSPTATVSIPHLCAYIDREYAAGRTAIFEDQEVSAKELKEFVSVHHADPWKLEWVTTGNR